jgi:hypothetical protein
MVPLRASVRARARRIRVLIPGSVTDDRRAPCRLPPRAICRSMADFSPKPATMGALVKTIDWRRMLFGPSRRLAAKSEDHDEHLPELAVPYRRVLRPEYLTIYNQSLVPMVGEPGTRTPSVSPIRWYWDLVRSTKHLLRHVRTTGEATSSEDCWRGPAARKSPISPSLTARFGTSRVASGACSAPWSRPPTE